MGLDLDLAFPLGIDYAGFGERAETPAAHSIDAILYSRLWLNRDADLFACIGAAAEGTVSEVIVFEDDGRRATVIDRYGDRLTWIRAGTLARVAASFRLPPWTASVFALVAALPPRTIVYLWWH